MTTQARGLIRVSPLYFRRFAASGGASLSCSRRLLLFIAAVTFLPVSRAAPVGLPMNPLVPGQSTPTISSPSAPASATPTALPAQAAAPEAPARPVVPTPGPALLPSQPVVTRPAKPPKPQPAVARPSTLTPQPRPQAVAAKPPEPMAEPHLLQAAAVEAAAAEAARLNLKSASLLVLEQPRSKVLVAREPEKVMPIASITKLMTAMVVLDAKLDMGETLTIADSDVDRVKMSGSRLQVGTRLSRREMLHLALMSSENRAASALARHYPGGKSAFIRAMNAKARALGMRKTHFVDSTGLSQKNVSTAMDLARMVSAAHQYSSIRQFTTADRHVVRVNRGGTLTYLNSNRLLQTRSRDWNIGVSKTGYTSEAGRCLVMHAKIGAKPVIVVLLNSWGKLTPIGDANRIKRWVEVHG